VQVLNKLLLARPRWLKKPAGCKRYRHWLINKGSLTRRLESANRQFSVKQIKLYQGKPAYDEAAMLGLKSHQSAYLREVQLCCAGVPVVFAHSVLPYKSLRGNWHRLNQLGNKSLGGALFSDLKVKRTQLEFKKLPRHHVLYRRAIAHSSALVPALWARRSVFCLKGATIMVTEVFLPEVLALQAPLKIQVSSP
jgi:chorismate--pyruvate lyase